MVQPWGTTAPTARAWAVCTRGRTAWFGRGGDNGPGGCALGPVPWLGLDQDRVSADSDAGLVEGYGQSSGSAHVVALAQGQDFAGGCQV
jgi:hypothetical protein